MRVTLKNVTKENESCLKLKFDLNKEIPDCLMRMALK